MYKNLTLALAVVIMPFSQKITSHHFITGNPVEKPFFHFQVKNNPPFFITNTIKKTAKPDDQGWLSKAEENIRKIEYHIKWDKKLKRYSSPNRKNNFRFYYDDKGFSVEPRATRIPIGDIDPIKKPDEIKYKTIPRWGINFKFDKRQVGSGTWQIADNKAEYVTNNITVQYLNNEEGMRQNFIVRSPLSKNNTLNINFRIQTKLKQSVHDNRIQFVNKKKHAVLNYEQLRVWDANGKVLKAAIKKNKRNKYSINVSTGGAAYPITIDPISTTPAAIVESDQAGAYMGLSVSSAGDVNADGYSDVIVGAPYYDNGQTDEGAAFVYHGSSNGISTIATALVESNQANAQMGYSVSSAGDVNGDGYSDVIVGAPNYNNGQAGEGVAFIYHGSVSGISTSASTLLESNQAAAFFGWSVASAGDVNGDGYSDVIVGAYDFDNGQTNEGAAFVYHGSVSGISTTAAAMVESNQAGAEMGRSVASAGDVNGDGYSDVIVGIYIYSNGQVAEGGAKIYHGSATGISTIAAATVESNLAGAYMGWSVASAGDVNGDGYSDVIVGAHQYYNGQAAEGAAFIYHGSPTGISTTAAVVIESNQVSAYFGISVACAGDVNGDGYSDVIVGAYQYDNGQVDEGAAFVYLGSPTGINTTAAVILESNQTNAHMGRAVASAGDVNGDGYSDVIVGAEQYSNGQANEGAAFVYHGSASGINTTATAMVESNQVDGWLGISVASAGDVNGDGYSDVIVGAPYFDNGQIDEGVAFVYHGSPSGISTTAAAMVESNQAYANMGNSVATAGDVNGDGFSDVVVGAPRYTNGQIYEGAAYIYHGSATGISTIPAAIVESNQGSATLGYSVASAGDVNGDGYSDIIAGAYGYSNGQAGEGAAYIYLGSSTGINTTVATIVESNLANSDMGFSVACAGDVNGDGYSDVIVGAMQYTNGQINEGAAYIYHGSSTGISTSPAIILESNLLNAFLGWSVSSAGDVNGDGYSDVIVGAEGYSNGQSQEGAAFVYHGSASGINPTAAAIVESNQASARMGNAVSSAGDVNGDGYSDVIVGAYQYSNGQALEGAAFIYLGSPTGISTTASAIIESNQVNAYLGYSVACAGDVNGDGYSDVIAGAYLFDNGQTNEGAAFLYHGDSTGNNKRNNLRLYNSDLTTPVNNSNFILGNFGAGLFAKSFLGRSKGKFVWETRLNYNPYSGTPITNSTLYTAQQASYTDMGLAGIEIKNLITKLLGSGKFTKLRARVKYNPVTAITGQVYSPWRNASAIIDANKLGLLPIELISFTAAWKQKGKTAQLNFSTDKESGICCFDIEKSFDGFNFTPIGSITAKNITGVQSYSFTDNNAVNKKQFYRLKIKGNSGKIEYSNIEQLQKTTATEILVFPNPTTDILQLQLNAVYGKMNVQILNTAGQTVKQFNDLTVSNQTITIPVYNLPPGNYWLRLQSGAEKQVLQFAKR